MAGDAEPVTLPGREAPMPLALHRIAELLMAREDAAQYVGDFDLARRLSEAAGFLELAAFHRTPEGFRQQRRILSRSCWELWVRCGRIVPLFGNRP